MDGFSRYQAFTAKQQYPTEKGKDYTFYKNMKIMTNSCIARSYGQNSQKLILSRLSTNQNTYVI